MSLEEIIFRHVVGLPLDSLHRRVPSGRDAAGAMMIPIPSAGLLTGVTGVETTAQISGRIVPLPEGAAYPGFIFSEAADPATAEVALHEAHARLHFQVKPEMPLISPARTLPMATR